MRKLQIEKISNEDAKQMTEEEFNQFSNRIKHLLAVKFPKVSATQSYVRDLKKASRKFTDDGLKQAAKDWITYDTAKDVYGHISAWDVSAVTDITELFKDAKYFDEDLSRWDVSRVEKMKGTFRGAASFQSDICQWDVAAVTDMR